MTNIKNRLIDFVQGVVYYSIISITFFIVFLGIGILIGLSVLVFGSMFILYFIIFGIMLVLAGICNVLSKFWRFLRGICILTYIKIRRFFL